ncbi:hypothetical protein NXF25_018343 [Crotalus adamanteus]|uniref:Uncharacterized protein n=1 Tax=Crotalus adamanteus TaxID=8729 RepID=A0AAW1AME2_CROAD
MYCKSSSSSSSSSSRGWAWTAIGGGPYGYGITDLLIGSGLATVNQPRHLPSLMMRRNKKNPILDWLSPGSTRTTSDAMALGHLNISQ